MNRPAPLNMVFASGHKDALKAFEPDRRFFVVGTRPPTNPQQAERLRAHEQYLEARQRESGVRARMCALGCYSLYNGAGRYTARTVSSGHCGFTPAELRLVAMRMAYSEELANTCHLVDLDYEASGTVSPSTVALLRQLLARIGAA
jgi:hypothetical protein